MKNIPWVPIFAYIAVIALVFSRILIPQQGFLIFGDDIHRSYYFFIQYLVTSIKEGTIPWWNPYMFAGTPFLANPITNAFYPVNWLFFVFPAHVVYLWSIMLHLLIAMTGMYTLLRRVISNFQFPISNEKQKLITYRLSLITSLPAWGAGIVFGLSSFFAPRIFAGHIDVISAASYMPWIVWAIVNCQSSMVNWRRWCIISGGLIALQLFAGYHTMSLLTLEAVAIITVINCITVRKIQPLVRMFIAVLIGVGLAGVILLPIQQFVGLSIRTFEKPYEWSSSGSLAPKELIQLISPFALGDQYTYTGNAPNYWEHAIFVGRIGLIVAFLALVGLARHLQGRTLQVKHRVYIFGVLGIIIFGLWMSLGKNAPIDLNHILWRFTSIYHFLRIPARHLLLVIFGMSILIGYGLSITRQRYIQQMIVILLVIEMIWYAKHFITQKVLPEARHDKELIALLSSPPGCKATSTPGVDGNNCELYRILPNFGVWVAPRDSLDFDSVMEYKLFSTTGYDSTLLRNYYEFIDAINGAVKLSILQHDVQVPYVDIFTTNWNILNVKYLLVPTFADPLGGKSNGQFTLIKEKSDQQYRLYQNSSVLPRFFLTSRLRSVPDRKSLYEAIRTKNVDLTTETLVEEKNAPKQVPDMRECLEATGIGAEIKQYNPNRIVLSVVSPCPAALTSSEVMYPGWEAYVDGKRAELFEANLAFRTLLVPQGEHTVELRFNPKIFYYGGMISFFTLIASTVWWRRS